MVNMKTFLLLLLSCLGALGQGVNLFPGPGSPLQLDSTRLYPAIVSGGGGTIIVTNAYFTYLTNNIAYITNLYSTTVNIDTNFSTNIYSTTINATTITNNTFVTTNVTVYDSVTIQTNLTVNNNVSVKGKGTFNYFVVTNQTAYLPHSWSGPSNALDLTLASGSQEWEYSTFTPVRITGISADSGYVERAVLGITNSSTTNITITGVAGIRFPASDTQAGSYTLTNGDFAEFLIEFRNGKTNAVIRTWH